MSVQFMENFSNVGGAGNEAKLLQGTAWAEIYTSGNGGLVTDPDGVSSGECLRVANTALGSGSSRLVIPTAGNAIGVALRWWIGSLPGSEADSPTLLLRDGSRGDMYTLAVSPTGSLQLWGTQPGTDVLIQESGALTMSAGAHNHVEIFVDRDTGEYEVRVEGVTRLSGTDGSPPTGNFGIIEWWDGFRRDGGTMGTSPVFITIKDVVVWDDNGSVNNAFIGTVRVLTLRPNGDVSSGWTPSTGTSDSDILDDPDATDAANISAADTLPAAAIVQLENLPPDIVSVRAIQTMVRTIKTDGGDANLQVSLLSNGSEDLGADQAVLASYAYNWDISELDPDTAAQWTPTAVDLATLKINRTL